MKFSMLALFGSLALVGCSNTSPVRPESTSSASSAGLTVSGSEAIRTAAISPDQGFGFNGVVSGFGLGRVFLSGGGTFDLGSLSAKSSGGFSCLDEVEQGPLSMSLKSPAHCLTGQGVRWDTAQLLTGTGFRCTTAEQVRPADTGDNRVVLQADFYRAGDANDESFTAQMIVSETDLDPFLDGIQTLWVQGVGCGEAIVHFSR